MFGEEKIPSYLFTLSSDSLDKDLSVFNSKTRVAIASIVAIMAGGALDIRQFNFGIV